MPLIEVIISAGRTLQQLRDLVHGLHEAVVATVGARPKHVTVIVREVPRDRWAVGDVTLSEADARRPPG